jgi:hypothetical protein
MMSQLTRQIDYLKIKLDDQEQYSRRTNLKIPGIKEQGREENTDDLDLDVINNLILNIKEYHYKNKSLCKQLRYIRFVYANNIQ